MSGSAINLRVLGACSIFASKDEARYYLNGVCLEIDERGVTYAATDGHRLISYRDELPLDDEDNPCVGTFIIPTSHCKHFKLGKEDLGEARISAANAGRLTISYGLVDVTFVPIDGVYPDWRRTIPATLPSGAPAQFNLKLLGEFQKISDALELPSPFVAHNGEQTPAPIWFSGHPHIVGLIMPMRHADEMKREAPQWARRGPDREQSDIEDRLRVVPMKA